MIIFLVINDVDAKHVRKEMLISLLNRSSIRKSPTAIKSEIDELAALFADDLNMPADSSSDPFSLLLPADDEANWESFKDIGFY